MDADSARVRLQKITCARYGAEYMGTDLSDLVGIAENIRSGVLPINGLRHPRIGDTSGWYIWAGDTLPDDPDFFRPLHASHVAEWCSQAEPCLGLAPGWRFLIAGDYEDVWFDETLLNPT